MERNSTTNSEVNQYDAHRGTFGRLAMRLMGNLRRLNIGRPSASESEQVVIYQGSGAPILGNNHNITSKEEADALVDALLGRTGA